MMKRHADAPTTTMWLSKYALVGGVVEIPVKQSSSDEHYVQDGRGQGWNLLKIGRDVHHTRDDAVQAAEVARNKKVASLKKQIAKYEKLKF